MNNLNSVLLEGNLTRDPQLHETPKGTRVCNFGLAVNRYYRHDENTVKEVSFFEVESWTRLAEYASTQLKKGKSIRVVGYLKQDRWEDQEGHSHSKIKIVAEHLELAENKNFSEGDAPEEGKNREAPGQTKTEEALAEFIA
ncbi:MAG: single-stranded DNA-binding protein [Spirochaetales bacterium]|nr:single-stranded DNA-binding protein [Spirochaetales bacterium]